MKALFYKAVCIFSPQVLTIPWVKYSINRLFRNSHTAGEGSRLALGGVTV